MASAAWLTRRSTCRLGVLFVSLLAGYTLACAQTSATDVPAPIPTAGLTTGQTPLHVLNGTAIKVDRYEPGKMLRLVLALKPPHLAEEAAFLEDVQDQSSPHFHQFLSAEEWNRRFGPSVADEKTVVEWAEREGFTVTHRYNHRMSVDVEAPVGTIEQALHVTINHYKEMQPDGTLGEARFSNDRDPLLPSPVSEIVESVLGMNSYDELLPAGGHGARVPHPDYVAGPVVAEGETIQVNASQVSPLLAREPISREWASPVAQTATPIQSSAPPSGIYQPIDMYAPAAYDFQALSAVGRCCNPLGNPGGSPRESSIAIAAFGDVSATDLKAYLAGYPYLASNIKKEIIDGSYVCNNNTLNAAGNKVPDANCVEVTLDTDWSLSTGNSFNSYTDTATQIVYEGSNFYGAALDVFNQILHDNTTRVLTTSWGCPEDGCGSAYITAEDHVLASLVGQGWTILAASGDQGATGDCKTLSLIFPASDPNVVATGGTLLLVYPEQAGFSSEVSWTGTTTKGSCATNNGGSTGGVSASFTAIPTYQSGMGFKGRAVPDIALNAAAGQTIYYNGSWLGYGGTSIVAPEMAGFFAQENAYLLSLGNICGNPSLRLSCATVGNANYAIYNEGRKKTAVHNPFYDVTSGCNSNDVTVANKLTPFCAKTGYDQVTGWGSANMLQLAWAINAYYIPTNAAPAIAFAGPTVNKWYDTAQSVTVNVQDKVSTGYLASGIAGYTSGWDSIPADPTSEATPAQIDITNSFYAGPQVPHSGTGSASAPQGCHTLHVRGWNNKGLTSADTTYGPVCVDTVAPTASAVIGGASPSASGWYTVMPSVALIGADATSGVAALYYSLNKLACSPQQTGECVRYTDAFQLTSQGTTKVYFFAKDVAGNFSTVHTLPISVDTVTPVTTASVKATPYGAGYQSPVTITLGATDATSGVMATYYALDTATLQAKTYTGPISVTAPGSHKLYYFSTDVAGNTEPTNTLKFTVAPSSSTALSVNPTIASSNQAVTMTAIVADNNSTTATGSVSFLSDGIAVGTGMLSSGVTTISVLLPPGAHSITASYTSDGTVSPSTSAPVSVQVVDGPLPTATRVFTTITNGTVGGTTNVIVHVTNTDNPSVPPTGTVTLINKNNGATTQSGPLTLTNGSATFVYNESYAGANVITAVYTPSSNVYAASTDATGQTITISSASPTEPANVNDQSIETNMPSTLSIIFSYPGQVPPSGAMTITVNGAAVGGTPACVYKTSGNIPHANCSLSYTTHLPPGQYPLVYTVAGDSNYATLGGSSILTVTP